MKHILRILTSRGDDTLTYDPAESAEVAEARAKADQLLGRGYSLFAAAPADRAGGRLKAFDPTVSEIIAVPQRVGG